MEKKQVQSKHKTIFKLLVKKTSFVVLKPPCTSGFKLRTLSRRLNLAPEPTQGEQRIINSATRDPGSPTISCTGQIKHNQKKKKKKKKKKNHRAMSSSVGGKEERKKYFNLQKMFSGKVAPGRRMDGEMLAARRPPIARAHTVGGDLRRLASRHVIFKNYDSREFSETWEEKEKEEEEEVVVDVDFSSLVLVGEDVSLEPRKEVNLWKRRTKPPPTLLQLN